MSDTDSEDKPSTQASKKAEAKTEAKTEAKMEAKTEESGGKTLRLKRTVESGQVRQSFSHGRSKAVVVEKRRKRTIKHAATSDATIIEDETPPTPTPAVAESPEGGENLSRREQAKRLAAVEDAKRRAEEEQRAKQEAEKAAEIAKRKEKKKARSAAKTDPKEADAGGETLPSPAETPDGDERREGSHQSGHRRQAADTNARSDGRARADEDDKPRHDVKRLGERRTGERRRRAGKLTINDALNDEERVRSLASIKRRREREKRQAGLATPQEKLSRTITLPDSITIQELANRMAERAADVIKILMQQGVMAKINDAIDADTAQIVAEDLGHRVKRVSESDIEEGLMGADDDDGDKTPRPPVVTIMGHVDHGKTSLLDALRQAKTAEGEAGGITQHIGAYQSFTQDKQAVSFIDTPGHAAFTTMRARGAKVTDIVVLVVAADDGVRPQTIEAIAHAKAAGAPMIVAINKMDKPEADAARVKNELLQHEVIAEDMGGDVQMVEVSATSGGGLEALLEAIILQAELMDLRANAARPAEGVVIEARLDKGRGPVATILIQRGTLRAGDIFVAGQESGRVRVLMDANGAQVKAAPPSMPVEVLGISGVPRAGEILNVVESEARAREVADYRARKAREQAGLANARVNAQATSLDQLMAQKGEATSKKLTLIIKGDVQGSVEAIAQAAERLGNEDVVAHVVYAGVGGISESDITLATTSQAMVIGFNVRANAQARLAAEAAGIQIRYYNVIYDLVDDLQTALSGLLAPDIRETLLGKAAVLDVFAIKGGKAAGCRIDEGLIKRGLRVRIIRDDIVIHEGALSSLRRFKDEVKEAVSGQECGMAFENFSDLKAGDMVECFEVEEVSRALDA